MRHRRLSCLLLACAAAIASPAGAQSEAEAARLELTLDEAREFARSRAPVILAARARIDEGMGRLAAASLLLRDNPVVDAGAGPRFSNDETSLDLAVGVAQLFELGGKRSARIEAGRADVDRVSARAQETTRLLLHDVSVAFLRARHAAERLAVARDSDSLAAEVARTTQRRFDTGDVGTLDVRLAELSRARLRAAVSRAEADLDGALGMLKQLLGLGTSVRVVPRGDLLERRRYELEALLSRAPERGDLQVLAAALRQADAEARFGAARAWPDLGVRLGYAREEGADIVTGSLALTLPLFDHGQGLAQEARARGRALQIELDAGRTVVGVQIERAYASFRILLDAVEEFEREGLPRLGETESLARRSYTAGAMPLPDLLATRRELIDARLAYVDLLLATALAGVELETATGLEQ